MSGSRIVGYLGLALHVAVGLVPFAVTGLVAPLWGVTVLGLVWVALLVLAFSVLQTRPALVPAVPAAAVVIWLVAVAAGGRLLGWRA